MRVPARGVSTQVAPYLAISTELRDEGRTTEHRPSGVEKEHRFKRRPYPYGPLEFEEGHGMARNWPSGRECNRTTHTGGTDRERRSQNPEDPSPPPAHDAGPEPLANHYGADSSTARRDAQRDLDRREDRSAPPCLRSGNLGLAAYRP